MTKLNSFDNTSDYPEITSAIDASVRILLKTIKNSGLENPDIVTEINIENGAKYIFKFERIDLD